MSINILKRKRIITSVKEANKILNYVDYYGLSVIAIGNRQPYKSLQSWQIANKVAKVSLSQYIIIELKDTKVEITTRYHEFGTPATYIFDLNEEDIFAQSGLDCFKEFSRYYTVKKAETYNYERLNRYLSNETGKYVCSAKPILGYNAKYEKQELKDCYEYDINSAYAAAMLNKIPDLQAPIIANYPDMIKVNKNEIGFVIDDNLSIVKPGDMADIKFKLIDTPNEIKKYLLKWYNKKKTATGNEKLKAKAMLNLPIGYCQRYNPFLRSYIVNKCNEVIKGLINEDTLFWNTDAIFSKKRRPELELGTEIGQFKEVKCDTLSYIGNVYQINHEDPTYRGIAKAWFAAFEKQYGRKYDLLKDNEIKLNRINYYTLNWDALKLEVSNYEKVN